MPPSCLRAVHPLSTLAGHLSFFPFPVFHLFLFPSFSPVIFFPFLSLCPLTHPSTLFNLLIFSPLQSTPNTDGDFPLWMGRRRLVASLLSPQFRGARSQGILHTGRVILFLATRTYRSIREGFIRQAITASTISPCPALQRGLLPDCASEPDAARKHWAGFPSEEGYFEGQG